MLSLLTLLCLFPHSLSYRTPQTRTISWSKVPCVRENVSHRCITCCPQAVGYCRLPVAASRAKVIELQTSTYVASRAGSHKVLLGVARPITNHELFVAAEKGPLPAAQI